MELPAKCMSTKNLTLDVIIAAQTHEGGVRLMLKSQLLNNWNEIKDISVGS